MGHHQESHGHRSGEDVRTGGPWRGEKGQSQRPEDSWDGGAITGMGVKMGVLTGQHGQRGRQKHALKGPVGKERWTQARAIPEAEETGLGDRCEAGG